MGNINLKRRGNDNKYKRTRIKRIKPRILVLGVGGAGGNALMA